MNITCAPKQEPSVYVHNEMGQEMEKEIKTKGMESQSPEE